MPCSSEQPDTPSQQEQQLSDTTIVAMSGNTDSFERQTNQCYTVPLLYVPIYPHIYQ